MENSTNLNKEIRYYFKHIGKRGKVYDKYAESIKKIGCMYKNSRIKPISVLDNEIIECLKEYLKRF